MTGCDAIAAQAAALVDCGGGDADKPFERAAAFHKLGYRVAIVRDSDKKPTEGLKEVFTADGGRVIAWQDGRTLEDELFLSVSDGSVDKLIDVAVELHGEELVNEHIKSASQNTTDLNAIRGEALFEGISPESRHVLGKAARTKKAGWFKSVTWMEKVAREIVGPDLANADAGFSELVDDIFAWAGDGRE